MVVFTENTFLNFDGISVIFPLISPDF